MKVLFICHINNIYGSYNGYTRRSSGLYNSTQFIVEAMTKLGINAKIVEVNDNNDIDREVYNFKPDIVVIEAIWVVPTKFDILKKLHPTVKWFIHLHSNMPFLSIEGMAIEWIFGCAARGIKFIANSPESYAALEPILGMDLTFLPNVYLSKPHMPIERTDNPVINIGCFGAIRPLKNHLLQALAAIKFAEEVGKSVRFHINASRVEMMGAPVLKNLISLFELAGNGASLVQVPWLAPADFMTYLRANIDMALQVSLTETFNVVTADCVTMGLPVVVSKEVKWVSKDSQAEDDSIESIVRVMHRAWNERGLITQNQELLKDVGSNATDAWCNFLFDNK